MASDLTPLPSEEIGLLEGIATTRAIRRYTAEPVTDEQLRTVLWAASRAPTGSNRQGFRFVVLRDGTQARVARALLGEAAREMWGAKRESDGYDSGSGARADSPKARMAATMSHYAESLADVPVIILVGLVRHREPNAYEGAHVYPACQNLLLAARAIGLGGVLTQLHGFVEPQLRDAVGIPPEVALHATITLGRPAGRHGPVRRRPLSELVYEDAWGEPAPWAEDPPGTRFTSAGPPRGEPVGSAAPERGRPPRTPD